MSIYRKKKTRHIVEIHIFQSPTLFDIHSLAQVADFDAVAPSDAQLTIEIQKNWDHLPKSS